MNTFKPFLPYTLAALGLLAAIIVGANSLFSSSKAGQQPNPSFAHMFNTNDQSNAAATAESTTPTQAPTQCGQAAGIACVEYRNSKYHFSLYRSARRDIKEYDEGSGAATIVVQNEDLVKGFQIFIVPYSGDQVTEERFKMDNPSGVRKEMKSITIDGANGASFYSTNPLLGETWEVWFIHGGYLYGVTTLKALQPFVEQVLQTWKFI